jgi:hypothetical protein
MVIQERCGKKWQSSTEYKQGRKKAVNFSHKRYDPGLELKAGPHEREEVLNHRRRLSL